MASRSTRPRSSTGAPAPTARACLPTSERTSERLQMSDSQDPTVTDPDAQGADRKEGTPAQSEGVTSHGSESENPAMPSPQPKAHRPRTNQDWWPNQLD